MPGLDGTGPAGVGPMTGGGRGFCSPWGIGAITGAYRGFPRTGYGYPYYGARPFSPGIPPFAYQVNKEPELSYFKTWAQTMRDELKQIEARIKVLEGGAEA
jgi:hypothetical protein